MKIEFSSGTVPYREDLSSIFFSFTSSSCPKKKKSGMGKLECFPSMAGKFFSYWSSTYLRKVEFFINWIYHDRHLRDFSPSFSDFSSDQTGTIAQLRIQLFFPSSLIDHDISRRKSPSRNAGHERSLSPVEEFLN